MKNERHSPAHAPQWLVLTAFAAVYIIWGSTYLGIRYAVESIPSLLMAGSRNLAAGLLMYAFVRPRCPRGPTLAEWRDGFIIGGLLLGVGNGGVSWAEQFVPSSTTALIVAVTPAWIVIFDWLRPKGTRPTWLVALGLAIGFAGVAVLTYGYKKGDGAANGWAIAVLMMASLAWSFGTIFSRGAQKPPNPLLSVAMQMTTGGIVLLVAAVVGGEPAKFDWANVTPVSIGAWLYLLGFGSLIGFTAYVWLLHVSTPARVATYGYVNPLIAVLLGCTLGREPFSPDLLVASVLIFVSVVCIVRGGGKKPAQDQAARTLASEPPSETP